MGNPVDKTIMAGGPPGQFKNRITDLQIVERTTKAGIKEPMLRFSLSWLFEWEGRKYGGKLIGCLAFKYFDEETNQPTVIWSPPKTRNGNYFRQMFVITEDWYNLVRDALVKSGYTEYIGSARNYTTKAERKQLLPASEIDPSLPVAFDIMDTGDISEVE